MVAKKELTEYLLKIDIGQGTQGLFSEQPQHPKVNKIIIKYISNVLLYEVQLKNKDDVDRSVTTLNGKMIQNNKLIVRKKGKQILYEDGTNVGPVQTSKRGVYGRCHVSTPPTVGALARSHVRGTVGVGASRTFATSFPFQFQRRRGFFHQQHSVPSPRGSVGLLG